MMDEYVGDLNRFYCILKNKQNNIKTLIICLYNDR